MNKEIEFIPFTRADYTRFKSWFSSEEELIQFAGTIFNYPISDKALDDYVADPNLFPHKVVLIETQEVIGHCEFNYTNKFPRLSRILIANKARRGQRFGERMIRKMAVFFFEDTSIDQVDLNVFAFNSAALRCYEKVGFEINPEISVDVPVNGKSWRCLNMILKRDNLR